MKALEHSGAFNALFTQVQRVDPEKEERVSSNGLFFFPETTNKRSSQAAGFIAMCICVLCVAFWDKPQTRWVVLGLAIDFVMRLVFGGLISPIGVVSNLVVIHQKPLYGCGPPKQFAALCGFSMSALSAALLLSGQQLGGTIVIGMLIAPTGAEGIFDFCLGCWIFGHAIRLKIVSPSVYRPYLNLKGDKKWAYGFMNDQPKQEEAEKTHLLLPNQVDVRCALKRSINPKI